MVAGQKMVQSIDVYLVYIRLWYSPFPVVRTCGRG